MNTSIMQRWIYKGINYQINYRSIAAREPRNAIEAASEKPSTQSVFGYINEHLNTLRQLGVNVLHLMPPFPIGVKNRKGIGSPYAVRDYMAIEPEYGTKEELGELVRHAHEQGFHVIVGMVPNHTSPDNVWVETHPEYYVKNAKGEIAYDADWSDTAKLNYRDPGLRKAMFDVYDHWLGFAGKGKDGRSEGVDGFRLDMAHFINDLTFWNEAVPELRRRHPDRELLFLAECYGKNNNLDLFSRDLNGAYDDDFYKLCQYFYARDASGRSVILPDPDAEQNEDFRDKLDAYRRGGLAAAVEHELMDYEHALPCTDAAPRLARYTDNHDEGRGVYRFGEGAVRAMQQLIFMSGHAYPFMLTGQEFGASNRPPIHERIQPCDKGYRAFIDGRVSRRDGVEFEGNLFARGYEKRREWYDFYKGLIALRLSSDAFTRGTFDLLDAGEVCRADDRHVIAFTRNHDRDAVHCAINLGPEPRKIRHASLFAGETLWGDLTGDTLQPFSAIVSRA